MGVKIAWAFGTYLLLSVGYRHQRAILRADQHHDHPPQRGYILPVLALRTVRRGGLSGLRWPAVAGVGAGTGQCRPGLSAGRRRAVRHRRGDVPVLLLRVRERVPLALMGNSPCASTWRACGKRSAAADAGDVVSADQRFQHSRRRVQYFITYVASGQHGVHLVVFHHGDLCRYSGRGDRQSAVAAD